MDIKLTEVEPCRKQMLIQVSTERVKNQTDEVCRELMKSVKIPGFRKGKVPRHIVEQRFRNDVQKEVIQKLLSKTFSEGIKEHDLHPIEHPNITDVRLDEKKGLSYKAVFDISPVFDLGSYKGLAANKPIVLVSDEEIQNTLKTLQEQNAQYVSISEDRGAEAEDFVMCDYVLSVNDTIVEQRENIWLESLSHRLEGSINKEALGLKKTQSKKIPCSIPANYPKKEFAGQKASLEITVKELKKKELAPQDDEFAKDIGFPSLKDLKKAIEGNIQSRYEQDAMARVRAEILEKLIKAHPFDVPATMVQRQMKGSVDRAMKQMMSNGIPEEEAAKNIKSQHEEYHKHALLTVKEHFLLHAIAKKENISVASSEVQERLSLMAKQTHQKITELEKNQNLVYNVEDDILMEKAYAVLVRHAKITDIKEKAVNRK
ncbi:trigger factor [PVC group bacterium]|nr:trigger factor [PVC group bacterium]